ncbi:ribonuclease P protein component [Fredinandcohnia quinoae]|uniref:Ribonuclease P protein component n=1 Tax=Fredinandcohnia quinoae TaxID=2918902 RepID=A0AAW5E9V6_9BACI|nr:ribonuclease P protein component [Fredinandcohnia sp. SECRCQ15]MCH1626787.1 ribonuclease P protein component [Fredinandcohnia sp. SECRCQ15]
MKKEYRIKRNQDFQTVFQSGKSSANRQFVVYVYERDDQDHFRIGLSVSKKIGNAVMRNRIKRLIRQFFLEHKQLVQNRDYIIIARKPVATMDYEEVKSSLLHVLRVARVLKKVSK